MVPKYVHDLFLTAGEYVTLHGKRGFADVIKVMGPQMGRLS